jgi:hypothetical protein
MMIEAPMRAKYLITQGTVLEQKHLERATRIELAFSAWEADVLPLNYARIFLEAQMSLVIAKILIRRLATAGL